MTTDIIPVLTFDDLVARATEIQTSDRSMAFTANTTEAGAQAIAARAVTAAIDLWADETGEPHTAVPHAMQIIAMARVIALGWDEWERESQPDLFDVPYGNALGEVRRDLG
jgi:hypothetical protein